MAAVIPIVLVLLSVTAIDASMAQRNDTRWSSTSRNDTMLAADSHLLRSLDANGNTNTSVDASPNPLNVGRSLEVSERAVDSLEFPIALTPEESSTSNSSTTTATASAVELVDVTATLPDVAETLSSNRTSAGASPSATTAVAAAAMESSVVEAFTTPVDPVHTRAGLPLTVQPAFPSQSLVSSTLLVRPTPETVPTPSVVPAPPPSTPPPTLPPPPTTPQIKLTYPSMVKAPLAHASPVVVPTRTQAQAEALVVGGAPYPGAAPLILDSAEVAAENNAARKQFVPAVATTLALFLGFFM